MMSDLLFAVLIVIQNILAFLYHLVKKGATKLVYFARRVLHRKGTVAGRKTTLIKFRYPLILAAGILLLLIGVYTKNQSQAPTTKQQTAGTDTADEPPKLQKGTPEYDTVEPKGIEIDSLGGWTRVSPPDRNPVFAYVQTLGQATITVSQQPLPENLQTDTEAGLSTMAKEFRANEMIMAGDTQVYIETKNNGAQSVILTKNNLLILIKSSRNIDNEVWKSYIISLK
jgi:hypothetical protein